ncbi:MAG: rRNA maturation RNase YbeY [Brumimicrobium sp.]
MIYIEEIDFSHKVDQNKLNNWLQRLAKEENKTLGPISIILGSDDWLLKANNTYLNHDFYTDIITFDYSEDNTISGDLLISVERVYDNADQFNVSRETEFNRVVVHGVLHLVGYKDKSDKDSLEMRKKEDYYLSLL